MVFQQLSLFKPLSSYLS